MPRNFSNFNQRRRSSHFSNRKLQRRDRQTDRQREREREREHPHAGKKNCITTDLRPAFCNGLLGDHGLFGDHGIVPRPSFVRYTSLGSLNNPHNYTLHPPRVAPRNELSCLGFGCCWELLYVHRNRGLIRDGSPGRPPPLSHSSWALYLGTCLYAENLIPQLDNSFRMHERFRELLGQSLVFSIQCVVVPLVPLIFHALSCDPGHNSPSTSNKPPLSFWRVDGLFFFSFLASGRQTRWRRARVLTRNEAISDTA